jgi:hypothetical protein
MDISKVAAIVDVESADFPIVNPSNRKPVLVLIPGRPGSGGRYFFERMRRCWTKTRW